ncbi:hypothetical protein K438DRAFT_1774259 [Mycena galopus ATCC 62051]|nr:hypothetical protein K438DRAFT_1774259 [Mycena galopus ATCC 62051]
MQAKNTGSTVRLSSFIKFPSLRHFDRFFPREIVMLPDPQVEEWQDEGVLWYPARFVRYHQNTRDPTKQFDFRFFEGIQWPGAQDDGFTPPSLDILNILLKPNRIGNIRIAANSTSDPPDSHPLVKIFDAAVTPLAKLLLSWPRDHPVINAFNLYTAAHSETRIKPSSWLPEFFRHPEAELAPLFRPPYAKLWDSVDLVSLPDEERSQRIANVVRPILQLLAIQHELKEPFNLNGDLFEDIVEDEILRQLTHKRHWDKKAFGETLRDFWNSHSIFDPTFRPITYLRLVPRESRRPAIGIDTRTESPVETQLTGTIRTRDNKDSDDENPGRSLKRRTMLPVHGRQHQSQDKKPCKERKMSPKGKVVAKGPGWVTLEMDESGVVKEQGRTVGLITMAPQIQILDGGRLLSAHVRRGGSVTESAAKHGGSGRQFVGNDRQGNLIGLVRVPPCFGRGDA